MTLRLTATKSLVIEVDVPAGTVLVKEARPGQPGLLRIRQPRSNRLLGFSSSGEIDRTELTPVITARLVKALRECGMLLWLEVASLDEHGQEEILDVIESNLMTALRRMFGITHDAAYAAVREAGFETNTISSVVRSFYEDSRHQQNAG